MNFICPRNGDRFLISRSRFFWPRNMLTGVSMNCTIFSEHSPDIKKRITIFNANTSRFWVQIFLWKLLPWAKWRRVSPAGKILSASNLETRFMQNLSCAWNFTSQRLPESRSPRRGNPAVSSTQASSQNHGLLRKEPGERIWTWNWLRALSSWNRSFLWEG